MGKVEEGQAILIALGLPPAQQTVIASYTLLALAEMAESGSWAEARKHSRRIHDILEFIGTRYGKTYAENTRETVRRQVIHQLEQARVVDHNPDEPGLATNSPRTHYALTDSALHVIQAFGMPQFPEAAARFQSQHGALLEVYRAARSSRLIPVQLASGIELALSPGKHNELQAAIIQGFAPRFLPGASLLYLGDTANKSLYIDEAAFVQLGLSITSHDKLPDVVLLEEPSSRLILIEAVTSHGPVSPKRLYELEAMLKDCIAIGIYVSVFPDFAEFKRHLSNIAWETEVWIAEIPDHMIHFNSEKFLTSGDTK